MESIGERVTYTAGNYTADSWGNGAWGNRHRNEAVYITSINPGAPRPVHISTGNRLGQGDLGWVEPHSQLWGFAKGCDNVPRDMLAVTQEEGAELVVRPQKGVFTVLKKYDAVIPRDLTKNLFAWGAINPNQLAAQGMTPHAAAYEGAEQSNRHMLKLGKRQESAQAQTVVQNFDNIRFEMPNVKMKIHAPKMGAANRPPPLISNSFLFHFYFVSISFLFLFYFRFYALSPLFSS